MYFAVRFHFERVKGIEPSYEDWKSPALPLCYTLNDELTLWYLDLLSENEQMKIVSGLVLVRELFTFRSNRLSNHLEDKGECRHELMIDKLAVLMHVRTTANAYSFIFS